MRANWKAPQARVESLASPRSRHFLTLPESALQQPASSFIFTYPFQEYLSSTVSTICFPPPSEVLCHVRRLHHRHCSPCGRHALAVFLPRGRTPFRDHHNHQHTFTAGSP